MAMPRGVCYLSLSFRNFIDKVERVTGEGPQIDNSVTRVVVGPGALGLFLATDIAEKTGVFPILAGIQNAQAAFFVPSLKGTQKLTQPVCQLENVDFLSCARAVVYICVRPENADAVCGELIANLVTLASPCEITIVYCSNGLWPSELFSSVPPFVNVKVIRAIVVAGFLKTENDVIEHRGGKSIRYAQLFPRGKKPTDEAHAATKILEWEAVENIEQLERCKFFVNLALALFVGPHELTNASLAQNASAENLNELADFVANSFRFKDEKDLYLAELNATIAATGANVNSLSLAAARGNLRSFTYFLNQLSEKHRRYAPKIEVPEWLRSRLDTSWKLGGELE